MHPEDDLIMISSLQHYSYCPRQCGLIHVEQVFDENVFTLRGRANHERVHEATSRWEHGIRLERALPLWSARLGLYGVADLVEFHPNCRVYPVEYKSAKDSREHDRIQLCAQAMCLEEMLGIPVTQGAIFSHGSKRRREVELDDDLRDTVIQTIAAVRQLLGGRDLPPAANDARCPNCSLLDACVPTAQAVAAEKAAADVWRILPDW